MPDKPSIRSLSKEALLQQLKVWGEPAFRAEQIWEWVHAKHVLSFEKMTNVSKRLRKQLDCTYCLPAPQELVCSVSTDGTQKYLLEFSDKTAVECVSMPYSHRHTACLSTQAGCAMNCSFCATGQSGFKRNLTADEIIQQALYLERVSRKRLTSIVLMGQGEPFLNYDNVLLAMKELNDPRSFNIGARHITVSTAGIIPGIMRLAQEREQFGLAVSLHAADQETRNRLMPGVKKYSLSHLYDALKTYTETTNRRPTYEYLLIDGVNDTDYALEQLVAFCAGTLCHVNLIELNTVPGSSFLPSKPDRVGVFQKALRRAGVEVTLRQSRGSDIEAACGQLSQKRK